MCRAPLWLVLKTGLWWKLSVPCPYAEGWLLPEHTYRLCLRPAHKADWKCYSFKALTVALNNEEPEMTYNYLIFINPWLSPHCSGILYSWMHSVWVFIPPRSHPSPTCQINKLLALTPLCLPEHENRGNPHSNRVGRPEGGDLRQYHPMSITGRNVNYRPQQRNQKEIVLTHRPQQEEMYIVPPTRNRLPQQLSQWETVITLNFHFLPRDFPSKPPPPAHHPPPPNTFLFLYKIKFLSLVCWTCLWVLL